MKKLLILALATTMAMPAFATNSVSASIDAAPYAIAYEIITTPFRLIKKAAKKVGTELKETGSEIGTQFAEIAMVPVDAVVDTTKSVKNSEFGQDVADVAGQFAAVPGQVYETAKDGYIVTVDATKELGKKIADSKFVAKVKDANQVIVDTTKKTATKVKDFASDVAKSEAVEDTADVFGQFAAAPREAWTSFAAMFKSAQEKIA